MKAFQISILLIVAISIGAWAVLDRLPSSAEETFISPNVRL